MTAAALEPCADRVRFDPSNAPLCKLTRWIGRLKEAARSPLGQSRHRRLRSRERSRRAGPRLAAARSTIWESVAAGFVLFYLSLFAIVRGASRRLIRQVREIAVLGLRREKWRPFGKSSLKDERDKVGLLRANVRFTTLSE